MNLGICKELKPKWYWFTFLNYCFWTPSQQVSLNSSVIKQLHKALLFCGFHKCLSLSTEEVWLLAVNCCEWEGEHEQTILVSGQHGSNYCGTVVLQAKNTARQSCPVIQTESLLWLYLHRKPCLCLFNQSFWQAVNNITAVCKSASITKLF